MEKYWVIGGLWLAYGALHSFLAANAVKSFIQQLSPFLKNNYRLFYNIIATLLLMALLVYQFLFDDEMLWQNTFSQKLIGFSLIFGGVYLLKAAFKSYDTAEFLGIKKTESHEFRTDGLLQYVRHPLYTATLLTIWGLFLFQNNASNLILASCLTLYLLIGIELEEKKLIEEFGDNYIQYRKRVPKLFPRF